MITPLKKKALHDLQKKPILLDANILMVGIERRRSDSLYSFKNMRELFLEPLFEKFTDIYIHKEVLKEMDKEARTFVGTYIGKTVKIVDENGLYGKDPQYTTVFNHIAGHELVNYVRGSSKDRGEVYSLAYAAYYNMNYFCSKEIMVDLVAAELEDLKDVDIITFDIVLLTAYLYYAERNDNTKSKGLKALYKRYCADVIKRHQLPKTLGEYIKASLQYL